MRKIVQNSARCRDCGEILVSRHRHDFQSCSCGNFVDGGHSYLRRGGPDPSRLEELSVVEEGTEP